MKVVRANSLSIWAYHLMEQMVICCAGGDGGSGPLHRSRGWQNAVEAAGDRLGRETWETEQRKDEDSQSGELEQEPGVPAHQGKMSDSFLACFEGLTAALLKVKVFWDVTLCEGSTARP